MGRLTAEQAAAWSGGTWSGPVPADVDAVSIDSRTVLPGALYIAIKGERCDGHAFVDAAFQKGAVGAVVSEGDADDVRPLLWVSDTRQALQDLAAGYRAMVAPQTIGVTGSVGKSTVKELLAAMLEQAHATAYTQGNWNNDVGLPLSLLAMEPETAYGVFEVGTNHPGEVAALCRLLRPDWGVVTNVGPSHLEFFGSEVAVAREKGELLAALPADGVAFLDADGAFFDELKTRTSARVVSVALDQAADYVVADGAASEAWVSVEERASGQRIDLPRVLAGRHQERNLLLAVAVAREAGMEWDAIRSGLATFTSMPMRWECQAVGGVQVVNDAYNANPVSMKAALKTFGEMEVSGQHWLVLGDMLELGEMAAEAHVKLGHRVADGAWAGVATVGALASAIADVVSDAGGAMDVARCATAAEAAAWLRGRVSPGDAVLLKGSRGMHLESVIDGMGEAREGMNDAVRT